MSTCNHIRQNGEQCKLTPMFDGTCWRHSVQTCAICMENTPAKRNLTSHRLDCNHAFHRSCILNWFIQSDLCPTCRKPQHKDVLIKFKHGIENRMRTQYMNIINNLEHQNHQLRYNNQYMYQQVWMPPPPLPPPREMR